MISQYGFKMACCVGRIMRSDACYLAYHIHQHKDCHANNDIKKVISFSFQIPAQNMINKYLKKDQIWFNSQIHRTFNTPYKYQKLRFFYIL